jgi:hypothetical protein
MSTYNLNPYNNTPTVLQPDSNRAAEPFEAPITITEGAVLNHGSQVPDNSGRCNRKTGFPPGCRTTIRAGFAIPGAREALKDWQESGTL